MVFSCPVIFYGDRDLDHLGIVYPDHIVFKVK